MRKLIRYSLTTLATLLLLYCGISLFNLKNFELLYSTNPPFITCSEDGCVMIYNLNIGNTGYKTLQNVRVTLSSVPLSHALLPPKVRNFGKVPRDTHLSESGSRTLLELGDVEPGKRVELSLLLKYDRREEAPDWGQILLGVESAHGQAQAGHPEVVTFSRFIYGLLTSIL